MYLRRIKDLREDKEVLQKEIAEEIGTTQQQYSRYETGINEISIALLIKLANYYNTSTDYILELTDDPRPYKRK